MHRDGAVEQVTELRDDLRRYVREFLGITDLDEQVKLVMPPSASMSRRGRRNGAGDSDSLRRLGAELLRQAADVDDDGAAHPAYSRILTELSDLPRPVTAASTGRT
jgi:hypothetical protein